MLLGENSHRVIPPRSGRNRHTATRPCARKNLPSGQPKVISFLSLSGYNISYNLLVVKCFYYFLRFIFIYKYRTVFSYLRAGTPQLAVARLLSLLRAEWFSATAPNSASHFVCRQNAPAVS